MGRGKVVMEADKVVIEGISQSPTRENLEYVYKDIKYVFTGFYAKFTS